MICTISDVNEVSEPIEDSENEETYLEYRLHNGILIYLLVKLILSSQVPRMQKNFSTCYEKRRSTSHGFEV